MSDFLDPLVSGVYRRQATADSWPQSPAPQQEDIEAATAIVHEAWPPTPIVLSMPLSRVFDRAVYLKLESLAPIRSFKFRGALVSAATIASRRPGAHVYTASTGNHGQGVAYAAARFGLGVTVYSPSTALEEKVQAMRDLGANVVIEGDNLSAAQAGAEQSADSAGGIYVEDGEDPHLMAGAATVAYEVASSDESVDALLVPVGGGNLVAGSLMAGRHLSSNIDIIGVQSTAASGATASWLAGEVVTRPCNTFAGGLATEFPGEMSWQVMDRWLETMVLVDEDDLYRAVALAFRQTGLIIEGAAAATIAALATHGGQIPAERIALIITGSWLSSAELERALEL